MILSNLYILPSLLTEVFEYLTVNRRWAKIHGKSIEEGHWRGIQKLKEVAKWCKEFGVKILTIWIFSTENAGRSKEEVKTLHNLFEKMLNEFEKEKITNVRMRFVGKLELFPQKIADMTKGIEEKTKKGKLQVIILMGYGGKQEIVDAVNKIIKEAKSGKLSKIDERLFRNYLYAPDIPDPDLIIRTGEKRLSGLLLWQSAYSEIYFCPKLWPDFEKEDLAAAIEDFKNRERRFGK